MDSIDIPEKSWGAQRDSQTELNLFIHLFQFHLPRNNYKKKREKKKSGVETYKLSV